MLKSGLRNLPARVPSLRYYIWRYTSKTFRSENMSSPIVIQPRGAHKASVIFLHGRGDTGHGWAQVMAEELNIKHVKYICPTASTIPITINKGMRMPAWYDKFDKEFARDDKSGIMRSVVHVHALIAEEEKVVPSDKIFVGGFSQGGAVALYSGLTYKNRLGGIIGLSCYLPLNTEFPDVVDSQNSETPIILCHGKADVVVDTRLGEMSHQKIKTFHPAVEMKLYENMGHSSCPHELMDVKQFLGSILGQSF